MYSVPFLTFSVEQCRNLKTGGMGRSRSLKMASRSLKILKSGLDVT